MATELTELRIDGGRLHFRGQSVPLNATTHKALTLLLAGGRVPLEALEALIWGDKDRTREAVYSLAFRCNRVLSAIGTAARVCVGRGLIGLEERTEDATGAKAERKVRVQCRKRSTSSCSRCGCPIRRSTSADRQ